MKTRTIRPAVWVAAFITAVCVAQATGLAAMHGAAMREAHRMAERERVATVDAGLASMAQLADAPERLLADELRSLRDRYRLDEAVVVDAAGRVIADAAGTPAGTRASILLADPDRVSQAIATQAAIIDRHSYTEDDPAYQAYAPWPDGGGRVLCIHARDEWPLMEASLRRALAVGAGAGLVVALISGAVATAGLLVLDRYRHRLQRMQALASAGTLAAAIAHEVKNPLAIILSSVELFARSPSLSDADRLLLEGVEEEVHRADDQINGFLDVVRDIPLRLVRMDLRDACSGVADMLTVKGRAVGVDVHWDLPERAVQVLGDRRRLRQATVNLVLNAIEALDGRGGQVVVRIRCMHDRADILIIDDGPGLPAEVRAHLFEPFVTTKPTGTGIGLSLVHRVMERHGGTVTVTSDASRGTTFTLSIPLEPPAHENIDC